MFLTQEDYRKIELWLKERTIKDIEFPDAKPLTGDEKVVVVQEEANRLTNIDTIFRTVPQSLINITDRTGLEFSSIENAIAAVPEEYRKIGALITFNLQDKGWQIAQFIGKNINEWLNVNKWDNLTENLQNSLKNISTRLTELETKTEDNRENINSNFQELNRIIGEDGKINSSVLPSYVDDIVDVYASYTKSDTGELSNIVLYSDAAKTKLITGESSKIYQNIAEGEPPYQFRWSGSQFAQTGANSLVIGEVTGTAFDGGKGKAVEDKVNALPLYISGRNNSPYFFEQGLNPNEPLIKVHYIDKADGTAHTVISDTMLRMVSNSTVGLVYSSTFVNLFEPLTTHRMGLVDLTQSSPLKYEATENSATLYLKVASTGNIAYKESTASTTAKDTVSNESYSISLPVDDTTKPGLISADKLNKIGQNDLRINDILHSSFTSVFPSTNDKPLEFMNDHEATSLSLTAYIYTGSQEPQENSYSIVTEQGLRNFLRGNANNTFDTALYNAFQKTDVHFITWEEPNAHPSINYQLENTDAGGFKFVLEYSLYNGTRDLNPTANNLVTEGGLHQYLNTESPTDIAKAISYNYVIRPKFSIDPQEATSYPIWIDRNLNETTGMLTDFLVYCIYPGATTEYAGEYARDLNIGSTSFVGEGTLKDYLQSNYALATEEKQGLITPQEKAEIAKVADKANISDLSNVLAEEVIDEPLLSEINTLTREEIKKDLFIDMWNQACGSYGTYNVETGYFELNGLTDITYEEALDIYQDSMRHPKAIASTSQTGIYYGSKARTIIPNILSGSLGIANFQAIYMYSDIETIIVPSDVIRNCFRMFYGCKKLRDIKFDQYHVGTVTNFGEAFNGCTELKNIIFPYVNTDVSFKFSPLLHIETFKDLIIKLKEDKTITVHPDVYAKLTGDTTNQAAAALTPEEATQWQQLVTDAAAKQITFVTA